MEPDWTKLARYVGGEASPEERADIDRWAGADPKNRRYLQLVRGGAAVPPAPREPEPRSGARGPIRPSTPPRRRALAPAGAIALLGLVVVVGILLIVVRPGEQAGPVLPEAAAVTWREITVQHGKRGTYVLRDNTRLTVAPGSTVRIPSDYGTTSRVIELEGHALFEVDSPPGAPQLQVRAASLVIEDIGTTFSVLAYPEDRQVQVVVAEGSVRMMPAETTPAGADTLLVEAGQMGTVDRASLRMRVGRADARSQLAWTRGDLMFSEATLGRVTRELARWYGVSFQFQDQRLLGRRINATFNVSQPLPEVLEALSISLGLQVGLTGDVVLIRYHTNPEEDAS